MNILKFCSFLIKDIIVILVEFGTIQLRMP